MQTTSTDRSTAAKSSTAIIASIACLACLFFLIAATIVLALIPVYTSTKQVTYNPSSRTSKQAELILRIDNSSDDRPASRRSIDNETALHYATVDSTGAAQLKTKIRELLPEYVEDIIVNSATIIPLSTRRRRSLSKRAPLGRTGLRVLFQIVFTGTCLKRCQKKNVAALKALFYSLPYQNFNLPEILIFLSSGERRLLKLIIGIASFVSDIVPGTETVDPIFTSTVITTGAAETTTTAATTTPGVTSNLSG